MKIIQLGEYFPGSKAVELFQVFLQGRLAQFKKSARPEPLVRDTQGALKAFEEGQVLLKGNRPEEARLAFEKAHALDPENPAITGGLSSCLKQAGLELYSKGDLQGAVQLWKRALEIQPADVETLRFLQRAKTVNKNL